MTSRPTYSIRRDVTKTAYMRDDDVITYGNAKLIAGHVISGLGAANDKLASVGVVRLAVDVTDRTY
jgi:hypothetical protein